MPVAPPLISDVLAMAMSHPIRVDALALLLERDATTKEIADHIDEPRNGVSYHLKVLEDLGCIEVVAVTPARGGRVVERTYHATERAYFDASAWERLGREEKLEVTMTLIRVISEDISRAMAAGTFFDPDDNHISRSPMQVDSEGWDEVTDYLDAQLLGLFEIQDRVDERCPDKGAETFPIKVGILQFRSPGPRP